MKPVRQPSALRFSPTITSSPPQEHLGTRRDKIRSRLGWIAKLLSLSEALAVFSKTFDSAPHFPGPLEPVFEVDVAAHLARVQAQLGKPVLSAPLQGFLDDT